MYGNTFLIFFVEQEFVRISSAFMGLHGPGQAGFLLGRWPAFEAHVPVLAVRMGWEIALWREHRHAVSTIRPLLTESLDRKSRFESLRSTEYGLRWHFVTITQYADRGPGTEAHTQLATRSVPAPHQQTTIFQGKQHPTPPPRRAS